MAESIQVHTAVTETGITAVGQSIAKEFMQLTDPFVVWLEGEMGAGKTTLTAAILRGLGLPSNQPVQSPTFTYMNEYQIDSKWFAHLDLYRADETFQLSELGIFDAKDFFGIFIEWPENGGCRGQLDADYLLRITVNSDQTRKVELIEIGL